MAYVDISNWGGVGTDMVFDSCDSKAFPCNVSVSAGGFPVGLRLCGLAYRSDRLNRGLSQGKTLLCTVALRIMRNPHRCQRWFYLVSSEHYDGGGGLS